MWLVEGAGADPAGDALPGVAIRAVRMDDVLADVPTFTAFPVAVPLYLNPFPALQPGGVFNTNDSRVLNAAWRGDRLVASQTVAGLFSARARWYDLSTAGLAPALRQSGEVNPGLLVSTYYPSVEVNPAGDLGMTYMQSSYRQYVSVYVTGQKSGAAPGSMQPGVLVRAGQGTYLGTRGGDYSGISVDPVDGTFWAANEYARSSFDLWGTWVANFAISSTGAPSREATLAPREADAAGANIPAGGGPNDPGRTAGAGPVGLRPGGGVAAGGRRTDRAPGLPRGGPDRVPGGPGAAPFLLQPGEWFPSGGPGG
jgi:hypothetical protein